jgi:hypothetical protein
MPSKIGPIWVFGRCFFDCFALGQPGKYLVHGIDQQMWKIAAL